MGKTLGRVVRSLITSQELLKHLNLRLSLFQRPGSLQKWQKLGVFWFHIGAFICQGWKWKVLVILLLSGPSRVWARWLAKLTKSRVDIVSHSILLFWTRRERSRFSPLTNKELKVIQVKSTSEERPEFSLKVTWSQLQYLWTDSSDFCEQVWILLQSPGFGKALGSAWCNFRASSLASSQKLEVCFPKFLSGCSYLAILIQCGAWPSPTNMNKSENPDW